MFWWCLAMMRAEPAQMKAKTTGLIRSSIEKPREYRKCSGRYDRAERDVAGDRNDCKEDENNDSDGFRGDREKRTNSGSDSFTAA